MARKALRTSDPEERDRLLWMLGGLSYLFWEQSDRERDPRLVAAALDRDVIEDEARRTVADLGQLVPTYNINADRGSWSITEITRFRREPAAVAASEPDRAQVRTLAAEFGSRQWLPRERRDQLAQIVPYMRSRAPEGDEYLWQAAIGLAHLYWRNTQVEDWHASPEGLTDGEMMRNNSAIVKLIHRELLQDEDFRRIARMVSDPERRLADGRTLVAYARPERFFRWRHAVLWHAETHQAIAEALGRETVLLMSMSHPLAAKDWHGTRRFQQKVKAFCIAVDDPENPHWATRKKHGHWPLPPRPAQIADTADLRRLLLAGPDLLDAESAEWCVDASIEFARERDSSDPQP